MSVQFPRSPQPARIPPHPRRRKRPSPRKLVWSVIKVTVVVVLAAMIGTAVAGKIARPFQLRGAEDRELQRVQSELTTLRKENIILDRKLRYLKSKAGIASIARKLGYVKPGEISLVIPEDEPNSP